MSIQTGLSEDTLFEIVKYIFEKYNQPINASNLKSFVKNGVSFPIFASMAKHGIKYKDSWDFNPLTKKSNNLWGMEYLYISSLDLKNLTKEKDINGPNYPRVIELILRLIVFENIELKTIFSKSKKLFKTIGVEIHKEKEIYNELYVIRLLDILTDHEFQLIESHNDSTDFEQILLPVFTKYHIPFFFNSHSFEYDEMQNTNLQYQIIFDKFQEKIENLLEGKTEDSSESRDRYYDEPYYNDLLNTSYKEEENLFLRVVNIICKDLELKCFSFDDIVYEGFIPKIVMHLLHINSIENVTDIDSKSIDVQIKNIEAVINYIKKDSPSISNFFLDFKSESSFSTRVLLKIILDTYFLRSSREELISRYYQLIEGIEKRDYPNEDHLTDLNNIMKIPYFIINGCTNCKFENFSKGNDFCTKHNIPLIMDLSKFNSRGPDIFYLYQLQIFYNMIDNGRKSLHFIETFKYVLYSMHKLKVPRISTIAISIKAKNVVFDKNDEQEQTNEDDDEEEEEEIEDLPIKMNQNPTQIRDRLKEVPRVDQNQIETPEQFWNPEEFLNNAYFEKGILFSNKQKRDDSKSLKQWNKNINEILKIATNKKQDSLSIDIPNSDSQAKYYKLFYYNEESKLWIHNSESSKQLEKDLGRKRRYGIKASLWCYLDSNEEDLISLNSKFINGSYPKFDNDNEIFVYALIGSSLPNIIDKFYSSEEEESLSVPILFLIHVPEDKKKHPNISTIIIQIYVYLSLYCETRIVVLNKSYYKTQVHNMLNIFNIVDKSISFARMENEEKKSKRNQEKIGRCTKYYRHDDDDELIRRGDLGVGWSNIHRYRKSYSASNIVFLINDKSIKNYNTKMDDKITNCELFTDINAKFDNNITMNIININDPTSYKGFLYEAINLLERSEIFRVYDDDKDYIKDISFLGSRYISIKQSQKDQFSIIRSMVQDYFKLYSSLNVMFKYEKYIPKFDLRFINDCRKVITEIINEKVCIDRKILASQLNQSATENLEYLNYQILKVIFPGLKQLEKLKKAHLSFLEREYLDIIKTLVKEDLSRFVYEKNIDILNQQIEKDKSIIEKIFSPVIKKIEKKDAPKEESFKDVKQKGTSYIMKETENVREIKVTLEMKDDLRSIIEQDF